VPWVPEKFSIDVGTGYEKSLASGRNLYKSTMDNYI
jgi:hypothetical protein